jgi:hypothetical protein
MKQQLKVDAATTLSDPILSKSLSKNRGQVRMLAGDLAPPEQTLNPSSQATQQQQNATATATPAAATQSNATQNRSTTPPTTQVPSSGQTFTTNTSGTTTAPPAFTPPAYRQNNPTSSTAADGSLNINHDDESSPSN